MTDFLAIILDLPSNTVATVTERSQITLSVERCPFVDHVQLK